MLLPIAITRIVGAEALGVFTTASSLGLLLLIVTDWGFETRLPLLVSRTPEDISSHIAAAQRAKTRLWLLALAVLSVGYIISTLLQAKTAPLQDSFDYILPLILYSVWALARGISSTYSHALRGLQQFGTIARVENSLTLASHLLAVGIVFLPFVRPSSLVPSSSLVVSAIIICLIAGEITKSLVFMRFLGQTYRPRSLPQARGVVPFSAEHLAFVMMQVLGIVQSRAGIYALTLLATQIEVGYFSAVTRFTIALRIVPGALFTVLLPRFVHSPQSETLGKALLVGIIVGTLGSAVLYAAADVLIGLVYGERFAYLAPLLRVVSWLFLLQTLSNILEPYLLAHQAQRFVNGSLSLALCTFAGICIFFPINTAFHAALASVGLEIVLVLAFGIKSLTVLARKNPL